MRSRAGKLAVAFLTAFALIGLGAGSSRAQTGALAFGRCGESNEFACGHLTVPLDPSGAAPETITLAMRRHRAPIGDARTAVIALAGGPGQAAIPFTEDFTGVLGPILSTRDLIVLDQRGTGLSHPLSCHALETQGQFHSAAALIAECAGQIGPARAFYTSADSVADIEAIRAAGGYEKLVLYGTSYGTKVAELYAQEHPDRVEALVLDSVVPPEGPDPMNRATFAAIPRVLRALCAEHACAHVTPEPVSDLATLVRRTRNGPLRGRAIDGHGHRHTVFTGSNTLLGLLLAGDFSPLLRAELVTAVRAAAEHDTASLARLLAGVESGGGEDEGFDTALYFATACEEEAFPWNRAAGPGARLAQAKAAIGALPMSAIAPFTPANVLAFGEFEGCARWPFATPAPSVLEGSLPDVPTLILSGAEDLRTPTANARAVAARIPDSRVLVVPDTGHSVLSTGPACARKAMLALFADKPIERCGASTLPSILRPPPLPPTRLADVSAIEGHRGRLGRTLDAVGLTLADFLRQSVLQLLGSGDLPELPSLRSGGLRAGWAKIENRTFSFHGYSYVPGVTISGTIELSGKTDLRVRGPAATHGTFREDSHHVLVGTLGGKHVRLPTRPFTSTAIVGRDAQASLDLRPGGSADRALARADLRVLADLAR